MAMFYTIRIHLGNYTLLAWLKGQIDRVGEIKNIGGVLVPRMDGKLHQLYSGTLGYSQGDEELKALFLLFFFGRSLNCNGKLIRSSLWACY